MNETGVDNSGVYWLATVFAVLILVAIRDFVRWYRKPKALRSAWKGSGGYFVTDYRREISNIAKLLSHREYRSDVHDRFNESRACAELYTDECGVVARISIYRLPEVPGEFARYAATVSCNLSIESEGLIGRSLEFAGVKPVEFKALCFK